MQTLHGGLMNPSLLCTSTLITHESHAMVQTKFQES